MSSIGPSLLDRLADCTVRVWNQSTGKRGTGFFVAAGRVLTARHNLDGGDDPQVELIWQGHEITVEGRADATLDAVLLTVTYADDVRPPAVLLDDEVEIGDDLYAFGYPDESAGLPFPLRAVHVTQDGERLKVTDGQIARGLSGAPLLNRATGAVCGMVVRSIDELSALGGYAVPGSSLAQAFPTLTEENVDVHRHDPHWVLTAQSAAVRPPRTASRWARTMRAIAACHGVTLYGMPPAAPSELYGAFTVQSPEWGFVLTMATDPREPQTLFAATSDQGVYRSRDGGRSWAPINADLGSRKVRAVAASPFDDRLFAATAEGLWVSENRGETWNRDPNFSDKSLLTVALGPHDPDLILVGPQQPGGMQVTIRQDATAATPLRGRPGARGDGLKVSRDGGRTWISLPGANNVNGIWIDPEDDRIIALADGESGLYLSRDGTEGLSRVPTFPSEQKPLCVRRLPGDPGRILVGTLHGGIHLSDDDGATWLPAEGLPDDQVSDICVPRDGALLAATPVGLFECHDGGLHWERPRREPDYPYCIAAVALADRSVVVGTSGGGVYRRAAGQSTWHPYNKGMQPAAVLLVARAAGWLLAAFSGSGLYRSADEGRTWRFAAAAGRGITAMAVEQGGAVPPPRVSRSGVAVLRMGHGPAVPVARMGDARVTVLIGTNRGEMFRSADAGATWSEMDAPEQARYRQIRGIALSAPGQVGVLVGGVGFFRSFDDGRSWSAEPVVSLGSRVDSLFPSCHHDDTLFATTSDGVLRSADGGATWVPGTGFEAADQMVAVAESPADPDVVFAASLLRVVYRSDDGGRTFTRAGQVDLPAGRGRWATLAAGLPSVLLLGSTYGAHLSTDGGVTWSPLRAGVFGTDYRVNSGYLLEEENALLLATDRGILRRRLSA